MADYRHVGGEEGGTAVPPPEQLYPTSSASGGPFDGSSDSRVFSVKGSTLASRDRSKTSPSSSSHPLYPSDQPRTSGMPSANSYRTASFAASTSATDWTYSVWIVLCQCHALLYKELMLRWRRPLYLLMVTLSPALLLLCLVWASSLCVSVPIPAMQWYDSLSDITTATNVTLPSESTLIGNASQDLEALLQWHDVFSSMALNAYMLRHLEKLSTSEFWVSDAPLKILMKIRFFFSAFLVPGGPEVTATAILSNTDAADPFKVPTFDEYISTVEAAQKTLIGGQGVLTDTFEGILRHGKVSFVVPSSDVAVKTNVQNFIDYMRVSTTRFSEKVFCPQDGSATNGTAGSPCVFSTTGQLSDEVERSLAGNIRVGEDRLWAAVVVSAWDASTATLRYKILVNESMIPDEVDIDRFPQGIGSSYAMFAYNGYLTLQYELNEYFALEAAAAKGQKSGGGTSAASGESLSRSAVLNAVCNNVTKGNGDAFLSGFFAYPQSQDQQAVVEEILSIDDYIIESKVANSVVDLVDVPCLYEAKKYCEAEEDSKGSSDFLDCMLQYQASNKEDFSVGCNAALNLVSSDSFKRCQEYTNAQLLADTSVPMSSCAVSNTSSLSLFSAAQGVATSPQYGDDYDSLVQIRKDMEGCYERYVQECVAVFGEMFCTTVAVFNAFLYSSSPHDKCYDLFSPFFSCVIDVQSLCTVSTDVHASADNNALRDIARCLFVNQHLLTEDCKKSEVYTYYIPRLFPYDLKRVATPAPQYFCQRAHPIHAALQSAVVAASMPTQSYDHETLYDTGDRFIGIMLAVVFIVPFTAQVIAIAEEREMLQHAFMMAIGVREGAIMISRFVVFFLDSILASVFACGVLRWATPSLSTNNIFALLFMYSLSLAALTQAVGSVVGTGLAATFAAPSVMLAGAVLSVPEYSNFLMNLYSPSVLSHAVSHELDVGRSGGVVDVAQSTASRSYWILFGDMLLYLLISFIFEQLYTPNSWVVLAWSRCFGKDAGAAKLYRRSLQAVQKWKCVRWIRRQASTRNHRYQNVQRADLAPSSTYYAGEEMMSTNGNYILNEETMMVPLSTEGVDTRIHQGVPVADITIGGVSLADEDEFRRGASQLRSADGGGVGGGFEQLQRQSVSSRTVRGRVVHEPAHDGASEGRRATNEFLSNLTASLGATTETGRNTSAAGAEGSLRGRERPSATRSPVPTSWSIAAKVYNVFLYLESYSGKRRVLRNLSLDFYHDRLNCVVGVAGSGKSTLCQLLLGLIDGVRGVVEYYGSEQWNYKRENVGACFQRNVAWEHLTVSENISLVQMLKGHVVYANAKFEELDTLLTVLQLREYEDTEVKYIGAGTGRKLSVAMAFAGGSRVVILDEPTTGVDAHTKRIIWHLLSQNARDRCVIAMTKDVEDMDCYADAVSILYNGRKVASGTPEYISSTYGGGWIVTLSIQPRRTATELLQSIRAVSPGAALINSGGHEMSFHVLREDRSTLVALVEHLNYLTTTGDVTSLKVAECGLEDTFVRSTRRVSLGRFLRTSSRDDPDIDMPTARVDSPTGHGNYIRANDAINSSSSSTRGAGGGTGNNDADEQDVDEDLSQDEDDLLMSSQSTSTLMFDNLIGSDSERRAREQRPYAVFWKCYLTTIQTRLASATTSMHVGVLYFLVCIFVVALFSEFLQLNNYEWNIAGMNVTNWLVQDRANVIYVKDFNASSASYDVDSAAFRQMSFSGVNGAFEPVSADASKNWVGSAALGSYIFNISQHTDDSRTGKNAPLRRYGALALNSLFRVITEDSKASLQTSRAHVNRDGTSNLAVGGNQTALKIHALGDASNSYSWAADTILHNTSFPLSLPTFMQVLGTVRLHRSLGDTQTGTIEASLADLRSLRSSVIDKDDTDEVSVVICSAFLVLPFVYFGSHMVHLLVSERVSGVLTLKTRSRLSPTAYWLGNFTWDVCIFQILSITCLFLYGASNFNSFMTPNIFFYSFGMLLLFCCNMISMNYLISRFFTNASVAQAFVLVMHISSAVLLLLGTACVRFQIPTRYLYETAHTLFVWNVFQRFLPAFSLAEGMVLFTQLSEYAEPLAVFEYASYEVEQYMMQLLIFPVYLVGLIMFDAFAVVHARRLVKRYVFRPWYRFRCYVVPYLLARITNSDGSYGEAPFSNRAVPWDVNDDGIWQYQDPSHPRVDEVEDPSVAAERSKGVSLEGLQLSKVYKSYGRNETFAVENISVTVNRDVMAVIGSMESGKSTLLKCAAGDTMPSSGTVYVNGVNLLESSEVQLDAFADFGYVSENVALDLSLTPYLHVRMMATYRMLNPKHPHFNNHIQLLFRLLDIEGYVHVPCWQLSESLQQRVCVAVALVGFPPVLVLDNPTAQMEPWTRRKLWAALSCVPPTTSVLFSTNSSSDVNMHATRLLLLEGGKMKRIGDVASIKSSLSKDIFVTISVRRSQTLDATVTPPSSHTAYRDSQSHSHQRSLLGTVGGMMQPDRYAVPSASMIPPLHELYRDGYYDTLAQKDTLQNFFRDTWPDSKLVHESPTTFVFRVPVRSDTSTTLLGRVDPQQAATPGAAHDAKQFHLQQFWSPTQTAPSPSSLSISGITVLNSLLNVLDAVAKGRETGWVAVSSPLRARGSNGGALDPLSPAGSPYEMREAAAPQARHFFDCSISASEQDFDQVMLTLLAGNRDTVTEMSQILNMNCRLPVLEDLDAE